MLIFRSLRKLARGKRGAVSIIGALVLPVLLGMSGLALEYGSALLTKVETQRVADLSAVAGAMAYGRTQSLAEATMAGEGVGLLNGVPRAKIVMTLEPSPVAPGQMAVRATLTTQKDLSLARILNAQQYLDVTVSALAGAAEARPACIQALDASGSGITLSGGATVIAKECALASNASVTAPCGTSITTPMVVYGSAGPPVQCSNIRAPEGGAASLVNGSTPDPLADLDAIRLARSRFALLDNLSVPQAQDAEDIVFGNKQSDTKEKAAKLGCEADLDQKLWTFQCPGKSTVNIGKIEIDGGLSLDFGFGASASTTYNIADRIDNSGAVARFASGTYNIAQGIIVKGGSTTEFDAGNFRIGAESGDDAIDLGAGGTLTLGDPAVAGAIFEISGNVTSSGGSCLTFGAASYHDIAGSVVTGGGVIFGTGIYMIDGYLHLGARGGGSVTCNGKRVSLLAIATTIILSGRGVPSGNKTCANQAFCATQGYSDMKLTAPLTGLFASLAMIGPLNPDVHSGATMKSGATGGQVSGAFYFPNGPIETSGGGGVSGGAGGCLQLIATEVTLSGGSTAATECVGGIVGTSSGAKLLE